MEFHLFKNNFKVVTQKFIVQNLPHFLLHLIQNILSCHWQYMETMMSFFFWVVILKTKHFSPNFKSKLKLKV